MWSIAVEGREVGLAYSLTGRGEVGGASEALLPGRLWLVSRSGELSGSITLRRWSRGMAGMRNYCDRERGHLAVPGRGDLEGVEGCGRHLRAAGKGGAEEWERYSWAMAAAGNCETTLDRRRRRRWCRGRVYRHGHAEKLGVRWFDCTPLWSGRLARVLGWCGVGCVALTHRAENSHTR